MASLSPVLRSTLLLDNGVITTPQDGNDFLLRGQYVAKIGRGVFAWLPLGHRLLERVLDGLRQLSQSAGFCEVLFPLLQPIHLWEASERYERLAPVLARTELMAGSYVLNSTQEEVFQHYSSLVRAPLKLFQASERIRNEIRPASGLIRSLDFFLAEWYCRSSSREASEETSADLLTRVEQFVRDCGLPPVRCDLVGTQNGVSLVTKSQLAAKQCRAAECRACKYAARPPFSRCARCASDDIDEFEATELCDITFRELPSGTNHGFEMTAGLGVFRFIALLADMIASGSTHAWPNTLAPFNLVICSLPARYLEAVHIARELSSIGLRVVVDDSSRNLIRQISDVPRFAPSGSIVLGYHAFAEVVSHSPERHNSQVADFSSLIGECSSRFL